MPVVDDLAAFRRDLDGAELTKWADRLVAGAEVSARLELDELVPTVMSGSSRLGGHPDLPASVPWPRRDNGSPLSGTASLVARTEITVPDWDSADVEHIGLPFEETLDYGAVPTLAGSSAHRMLGHPDPIPG